MLDRRQLSVATILSTLVLKFKSSEAIQDEHEIFPYPHFDAGSLHPNIDRRRLLGGLSVEEHGLHYAESYF